MLKTKALTDLVNALPKVPKVKKTREKGFIFLATCRISDAPGNEGGEIYLPLLGNISQSGKDINIGDFPSRGLAFKTAKNIPDFLQENDTRIISVSKRITATPKTTIKITM